MGVVADEAAAGSHRPVDELLATENLRQVALVAGTAQTGLGALLLEPRRAGLGFVAHEAGVYGHGTVQIGVPFHPRVARRAHLARGRNGLIRDRFENLRQAVTLGAPQGLYELKFFFSSAVSTTDGDLVASEAIKNRIRQIIQQESPEKPLSDNAISELLKKEGVQVARRTVAKYRDQMKILPVKHRRKAC